MTLHQPRSSWLLISIILAIWIDQAPNQFPSHPLLSPQKHPDPQFRSSVSQHRGVPRSFPLNVSTPPRHPPRSFLFLLKLVRPRSSSHFSLPLLLLPNNNIYQHSSLLSLASSSNVQVSFIPSLEIICNPLSKPFSQRLQVFPLLWGFGDLVEAFADGLGSLIRSPRCPPNTLSS